MKIDTRCIALAFTATMLTGCAGIDVISIDSHDADKDDTGVRYYESSPYLLVHTDNDGGLTGQVVHLPDITKKRSAKPFAFISKNDVTLDFKDGVLTSATSDQDATEFPAAVVDALTKVAGAGISSALSAPKEKAGGTIPAPHLFKIVVTEDTIELRGGETTPSRIRFE